MLHIVAWADPVDEIATVKLRILRRDGPDYPRDAGAVDGSVVERDVPVAQILIKGRGSEYVGNFSHAGDVPVGDVTVEGSGVLEHAAHVGHARGVPG